MLSAKQPREHRGIELWMFLDKLMSWVLVAENGANFGPLVKKIIQSIVVHFRDIIIEFVPGRWLWPMSDGVFEFWSDQNTHIYTYIALKDLWLWPRGARVRFVVISNHSSYGSIQYSLAGGVFMVTPRGGESQWLPPLTPFYSTIYIYSQTLEKIQLDFNWILNFVSCILFNFKFCVKWIIECKNKKVQI